MFGSSANFQRFNRLKENVKRAVLGTLAVRTYAISPNGKAAL